MSLPKIATFCLVALLTGSSTRADSEFVRAIRRASGSVIAPDGAPAPSVRLVRSWAGDMALSELVNEGTGPARIKEVILFSLPHKLPPETPLYGEGFQMLSQTGGTVGRPVNLGNYTDLKHYKMPQPADA